MNWIKFFLLCISISYIFHEVIGIKYLRKEYEGAKNISDYIYTVCEAALINYLIYMCLKYSLPSVIIIIKGVL